MFTYYVCRSVLAFVENTGDVFSEDSDREQLYAAEEQYHDHCGREALDRVAIYQCLDEYEHHVDESCGRYNQTED